MLKGMSPDDSMSYDVQAKAFKKVYEVQTLLAQSQPYSYRCMDRSLELHVQLLHTLAAVLVPEMRSTEARLMNQSRDKVRA